MCRFNRKKQEEAREREQGKRQEHAGKEELSLHELTECVGELVEVMRLLRRSHLDLHEKVDWLLYGYDCQGKDLGKNDESTAADPAPVDV